MRGSLHWRNSRRYGGRIVTYSFNPRRGLILVSTELYGPTGSILLRLALDTGATATMINVAPLTIIGYNPSLAPDRVQVTTGSGVEYPPKLVISRIIALGKEGVDFAILAHTLPPSSCIDGVLGLDFFRDKKLNVDFRQGYISLD